VVWMAGLGFLLFHRQGERYRVLGVTYLALLAIMMALKGKDYYLAPVYPMLYAAGGVLWERCAESRRGLGWVRVAAPAIVVAAGLVSAPLVLPLLPPERIEPYMERLGIKVGRTETNMRGRLPQHFADEFGWPEMVETVAGSTTRCRRQSARRRRSWRATTAKPVRLTFSVRVMACRKPLAAIRTITIGDRGSTPARA